MGAIALASLIRPATNEDSRSIGSIGPAAYQAAYAYLWDSPDALSRHLSSFGESAINEFLQEDHHLVWVALRNEQIVGFLTMDTRSLDPISHQDNGAAIPRIYLLPSATNCGFGKQLFDASCEHAQGLGRSYIWLDVMKTANEAIAAYRRWGFSEIGESNFSHPVKWGMQHMVVMRYELS